MKKLKIIAAVMALAFVLSMAGCKSVSKEFSAGIDILGYTEIDGDETPELDDVEDGYYQKITDTKNENDFLIRNGIPPLKTLDNAKEIYVAKRDIKNNSTETSFVVVIFEMNNKDDAKTSFDSYEEHYSKYVDNLECDDLFEIDNEDNRYAFSFSVEKIDASKAIDIRLEGNKIMVVSYSTIEGEVKDVRKDLDSFYKSLKEESVLDGLD